MTRISLGETAKFINGAAFKPSDWEENGLPIIRIQNLTGTGERFNYTTRKVKPDLVVEPGDLLVSWSATLDVYRWNGPRGLLNQHIFKVLPSPNVDPDYLFYALKSALSELSAKTHGSTMKHVVRGDFESTRVLMPEPHEQRRIVDILSRAEGIVRLRREAQKKAAELIPAFFLDMFGDPATNPKGWPVSRIGDLGRVQLGRQRAPKYQTGAHTHPYIRVANVYEDEIDISDVLSMDFDSKDYAQYRLEYGDILLNEGQSTELVGRPAMWRDEIPDCCFQNTLIRFQPDSRRMIPEFALSALLHYYRSGSLSQISSKTSNVAHLGAGRFSNLMLFWPPLDLQIKFSQRFEQTRSIRIQQETAMAKAEATFDALLSDVFSASNG